jgi:MerR family transcriptional regulator, copper efflux regulator
MRALPMIDDVLHADCGGDKSMKIGDLAKITNKTARALRLYEELGLLVPSSHSVGGFRLYGDDAVARVHWISKLQELGFTLQHIQELVGSTQDERNPRQAMARVRSLFDDKLAEVAAQITRLSTLQHELTNSLRYLQECNTCDQEASLAPAINTCHSCNEHSEQTPSLVGGLTAPSSTSARTT